MSDVRSQLMSALKGSSLNSIVGIHDVSEDTSLHWYMAKVVKGEDGSVQEINLDIADKQVGPDMLQTVKAKALNDIIATIERSAVCGIMSRANVMDVDAEKLELEIGVASNTIHTDTIRSPATFMIVNDKTIPDVALNRTAEPGTGLTEIGTSRYLQLKVFTHPVVPERQIILGFKGRSSYDAGYLVGIGDVMEQHDKITVNCFQHPARPEFYIVLNLR